jgi:hypothetical protein
VAQVEIIGEREEGRGWSFDVQVLHDDGTLGRHTVTLAWADYNLWSGTGADEPAAVVTAVVEFLLSIQAPSDLRASFDASLARRLDANADTRIPSLIRDQ